MSVRSDLRAARLEVDGHRCRWPGGWHEGPLQLAHLKQSSQGGSDTIDNVCILCRWHHDVLDNRGTVHGRRGSVQDLLEAFLDYDDRYLVT